MEEGKKSFCFRFAATRTHGATTKKKKSNLRRERKRKSNNQESSESFITLCVISIYPPLNIKKIYVE